MSESHRLYIGYTSDLRRKLKEHNRQGTAYAQSRGEWKPVYYEAYKSENGAKKRERNLKDYGSAFGHFKREFKKVYHRVLKGLGVANG